MPNPVAARLWRSRSGSAAGGSRSGRRPRPGGGARGGRRRTNPAFPLSPAGKSCLDRSISAITIRVPLTQYRQDLIPPVQCLRQPAEMLIDISDVENRAARLEPAKMLHIIPATRRQPRIIEPRGIKTHQGSLFDRAAGANSQSNAGDVGMEQSKNDQSRRTDTVPIQAIVRLSEGYRDSMSRTASWPSISMHELSLSTTSLCS